MFVSSQNKLFLGTVYNTALTTGFLTTALFPHTLSDTNGQEITSAFFYNQLELYVNETIGSATNIQWYLEFSNDNVNWYQENFTSSPTAGIVIDTPITHEVLVATAPFRYIIPINDQFIRISAKGTGTVSDASIVIQACLGNT